MLGVRVHRLRQTNVGPHGRAEEIEDPEGGDDPEIQLSGSFSVKKLAT